MKPRKIPMRMCVGCRQMKPKKELVRVVRSQDGSVVVDRTSKMPGRGAYLCAEPACLEKAVKARMLDRALDAKVGPEVLEALKKELERHELP